MRKLAFVLILFLLTGFASFAQQIKVTGKVTDASNGNPVEGAVIQVKGGKAKTIAGANGTFVINAAKGQTLTITSIGYTTQEIAVAADVSISLTVASKELTDVVVVGYGTQKRANVSGAIATLKTEDLTRRQVASASNLLQGLVPGVTVQQQSGRPGADGASIRIRGLGSFSASQAPLIVLDGVVITQNYFESIDPNAIDNISVMKDASAASIYGSRSTNGVIVVTTKRAKEKGMKISYNNFITKQVATAIPERVNAIDHMTLSNLAEQNRTGNPAAMIFPQTLIDRYRSTPANNLDIIDTDWLGAILTNNGIMHSHNITLSSGGDRVNTFTSVTYLKQQGLIPNNSYERYDIRFNPDFKISNTLTVNAVMNYNYTNTIAPSTGSPEFIIRQAIGLPAVGAGKFGEGMYGNAGQANNRNPIAMAEAAGTAFTKAHTVFSKLGFTYRPIKGLEIEGYWARDQRLPQSKNFVKNANIYTPNLTTSSYDLAGVWPGTTTLSEAWGTSVRTTYMGKASYAYTYGNHSLKALVGATSEEFRNESINASRTGFVNPNQPYLNLGSGNINNSGSAFETAIAGYFGRLNYSFADKYFLELNARRDASSRFPAAGGKQWGTFTAVSSAWIISKENFFKPLSKIISYAKLRSSMGTLGNETISDPYPFSSVYEASLYNNNLNGTSYYFNNQTALGLSVLTAANPEISWEKGKQWNAGIDISFAKYFTATADFYLKYVTDLLMTRPIMNVVGLGSPIINAGTMQNRGWEFSLNYKRTFNKLKVDATVFVADVRNRVNTTPGVPFFDGGSVRSQWGQPINSFFGYQSLGYFSDSNDIKNSPVQFGTAWSSNPAVGPKPGDIKYADINKDGVVNTLDRDFIGNQFPRYEYSINLNLSYGQFDLNLFGQGVGQRDNYLSGTGAVPFASADFAASLLEHHKDYWTATNPNALFPRLLPSGFGGNNYLASTHWIKSAAFFRIKNLNIGYRLPESVLKKVGLNAARIYVSGSNLITFTKSWKGFDPEINAANAEFYPLMKTFTAGVNITF